jgi:hypothetical protein
VVRIGVRGRGGHEVTEDIRTQDETRRLGLPATGLASCSAPTLAAPKHKWQESAAAHQNSSRHPPCILLERKAPYPGALSSLCASLIRHISDPRARDASIAARYRTACACFAFLGALAAEAR